MGHPVFESRTKTVIWWLAWLILGACQSLLFYYTHDTDTLLTITDGFVSMMIYSVLALAAWYPVSYFNKETRKPATLVINLIAVSAGMVIIWLLLSRIINSAIFTEPGIYPDYWNKTIIYRAGLGVLICILVLLTYYLIISYRRLSDKKLEESRLESLLKETELKMLRSQINPHFLFNSLNSVSSLTITDPDKAREMVIKLSDFMRYALSRKDEQPVTLGREMENLRLYLDIEKTRFGDRLTTEEEIEEGCLDIKIPNMLLQPLYENAIKHGVHESTGVVKITTVIRCNRQILEITIGNNYDPEAVLPAGTGTGLVNVQRRMELSYGKEASLSTEKGDGNFIARLKLPLLK
jgi:sensor histidine kinase YesM